MADLFTWLNKTTEDMVKNIFSGIIVLFALLVVINMMKEVLSELITGMIIGVLIGGAVIHFMYRREVISAP